MRPVGRVQAQAEAAPQLLICDIDLTETDAVRAQIPVLRARRTDLYQLKYEKTRDFTSLFAMSVTASIWSLTVNFTS